MFAIMNRKLIATIIAAITCLGGGLVGANAAQAADYGTMPSGCSISPQAPSLSGSRVAWGGSGYCDRSGINSFVAILIHNYDNLPDVRVATAQSFTTRPNWRASGTTCDNGGTTQYYTEAGYWRSVSNGGDVIRTSSQRTLTHC